MPTYDYRCAVCARETSVVQSIGEYCRAPKRPLCHGEMGRMITLSGMGTAQENALVGDRHYDGLQATDGTPIDTRTKHRQYMKAKGFTIISDFKKTWHEAAKERDKARAGAPDPERKRDVHEAFYRATQR